MEAIRGPLRQNCCYAYIGTHSLISGHHTSLLDINTYTIICPGRLKHILEVCGLFAVNKDHEVYQQAIICVASVSLMSFLPPPNDKGYAFISVNCFVSLSVCWFVCFKDNFTGKHVCGYS